MLVGFCINDKGRLVGQTCISKHGHTTLLTGSNPRIARKVDLHQRIRREGSQTGDMREGNRSLDRARKVEPKASEELLPLVYDELRRLAAHQLAKEALGHTLQPTALVHEAWLRLNGNGNQNWNSHGHFVSAAAEAMRRVLIESVRRKQALRRGARPERTELREEHWSLERPTEEILAVDEALSRLEQEDREAAELVKLRYFMGMSLPESAQALGISLRTTNRLWAYVRAWLKAELQSTP